MKVNYATPQGRVALSAEERLAAEWALCMALAASGTVQQVASFEEKLGQFWAIRHVPLGLPRLWISI